MQRRSVYLHQNAGRHTERLHRSGVQLPVRCDVALSAKEQNEILCPKVEFAAAMILQTVEPGIVSVAPAELHRQSAEQGRRQLPAGFHLLQRRLLCHVVGSLRQRRTLLQCLCNGCRQLALHNSSVFRKLRIRHLINLHRMPPYPNPSSPFFTVLRSGFRLGEVRNSSAFFIPSPRPLSDRLRSGY